ncbi:MAG TPA: hypothetical protein VMB71_09850 [Acetobacteraceae bacterium]|nr:hypothetical protein [Acetobacteraceae bacterium]
MGADRPVGVGRLFTHGVTHRKPPRLAAHSRKEGFFFEKKKQKTFIRFG